MTSKELESQFEFTPNELKLAFEKLTTALKLQPQLGAPDDYVLMEYGNGLFVFKRISDRNYVAVRENGTFV